MELKLKPNTILGIMRHLRKMIKLAVGESIITRDPFDGYSPERPKAEQKYLTREELHKIITTPLDHPCRYLTRDMFLFSAFTGLSYVDMCALSVENLTTEQDGSTWIKIPRQNGDGMQHQTVEHPPDDYREVQGRTENGQGFQYDKPCRHRSKPESNRPIMRHRTEFDLSHGTSYLCDPNVYLSRSSD